MAAVDIETHPPVEASTEITSEEWMLPVPIAQTVFSLVPAVAGGLAGMVLAYRLTQARAIEVKASEVILATALSFGASFLAVFLMQTFRAYEEPSGE